MFFHDAAGIIDAMLREYPRCSTCKQPATRRIEHALLIIGEQPRACDDDTHIPEVRDPSLVKFTELPQAPLVRAALKYLSTHEMKTSGTGPAQLTHSEGEDLLRCVESAAPGDINATFRARMWHAVNRVCHEPVWTAKREKLAPHAPDCNRNNPDHERPGECSRDPVPDDVKLPPSSVMRETFGDNAAFVEAAIAGDDKGMEDALAAKPVTFIVEKGGREVKRTTSLDEFLAACEAASGGGR